MSNRDDTIEVHESRFYYRRDDSNAYTLFALQHDTVTLLYPAMALERYSAHVLQLFNKLYCAICNCSSVSFVFCDAGRQITYKPNQNGLLAIASITAEQDPATTKEQIKNLHTSDLAISTHTIVYDYIQTCNGYFNVGISRLPCGCICIPCTLTDESIAAWLEHWKRCVDKSATCAILVLRDREGTAVRVENVDNLSPIKSKIILRT